MWKAIESQGGDLNWRSRTSWDTGTPYGFEKLRRCRLAGSAAVAVACPMAAESSRGIRPNQTIHNWRPSLIETKNIQGRKGPNHSHLEAVADRNNQPSKKIPRKKGSNHIKPSTTRTNSLGAIHRLFSVRPSTDPPDSVAWADQGPRVRHDRCALVKQEKWGDSALHGAHHLVGGCVVSMLQHRRIVSTRGYLALHIFIPSVPPVHIQ